MKKINAHELLLNLIISDFLNFLEDIDIEALIQYIIRFMYVIIRRKSHQGFTKGKGLSKKDLYHAKGIKFYTLTRVI